MEQNFCDVFVQAMKEKLPKGKNLAHILMETLCLGKESVYRRLRGEVAFTFDEIVILARHFNLSLDNLFGQKVSDGAMFNLQLMDSENDMDKYYDMLRYYVNIFSYISKDPNSELCIASNIIPFSFYPTCLSLTRYRICRWLYHNDRLNPPFALKEMEQIDRIMEIQQAMAMEIRKISHASYIWDGNIISSFVREIEYFASLRILSKEDIRNLHAELNQLLQELELVTITGQNSLGKPVSVYLSNFDFETSYGYAEREGFQICFFRVHLINSFDSQQKSICDAQKHWIKALKRHSTLISQSGEVERVRFFAEQRMAVAALEKLFEDKKMLVAV